MTKEECLKKCTSIANVLAKIMSGATVSFEERLSACKDAIDVFYRGNSRS